MSKALLVALREFLESIRTKAFWIGILFVPILLVGSIAVPALLDRATDVRRYAVIDHSGWLLEAVEERATYDDVYRLLAFVKKRAAKGEAELNELPAALQQLAGMVDGASDERLKQMARFMSATGSSTLQQGLSNLELDEDQRAEIARHQTELLLWRTSLSTEDARDLGVRTSRARFERVELPEGTDDAERYWRSRLDAGPGSIFAYFVIAEDPLETSEGNKYVSNNRTDNDLRRWFERLATSEVRARRFEAEEIAPDRAEWLQAAVTFEEKQLDESGEEERVETKHRARQFAPVAFTYLLWMSVFVIANGLLTNTIEEKSNRLIEVLLSSVSPLELMIGKILGIAATGLTVIGTWVVFFMLAIKYVPRFLGAPAGFDLSFLVTDPAFLTSFVVYFLLGYLFYACVFVGIGSICNTLKESQNLMAPVTAVLVIPLLALIPVSKDPNGLLAQAMSYVPPFTPFIMMNRAAGPPPLSDYVLTTLLLVASIAAATWIAAKVFRIGILMTGKPPSLREIIRWIGTPVGSVPETPVEPDGQ